MMGAGSDSDTPVVIEGKSTRINVYGGSDAGGDDYVSSLESEIMRLRGQMEEALAKNSSLNEELKGERNISAKQVHELRRLRDQLSEYKAAQRALQVEVDGYRTESRPGSAMSARPGSAMSRSGSRPKSSRPSSARRLITEVRGNADVASPPQSPRPDADDAELRQELDVLQGRLSHTTTQVKKLNADYANEKEKCRHLTLVLQETKDKLHLAEEKVRLNQGYIEELEEKVKSAAETNTLLENDLHRKEVIAGANNDIIAKKDREVEDATKKMKKAEKELQVKLTCIQELQADIDALRKKKGSQSGGDSYEAVLGEELQTMRESFQKQIDSLTKELETKTREHAYELREAQETAENDRKRLETKIDLLRRKLMQVDGKQDSGDK
eukprot:Rmarinus@m.9965